MKNFILILFALLMLKGGIYCKEVSADTLKPKCDYYTDNITIDYLRVIDSGEYKQNITGTVCDSQDKRSFIQIKNGLAHGKAEVYLPSGIFFQNHFQNGKQEGIAKGYDENGVLRSEGSFQNGKLEGIKKNYYESGALKSETNYKNGKQEGITKTYYESGALKAEENYKNDKKEGIKKIYYESGALQAEVNFKNDKLEGIAKMYYESGKLWATITYKNDKAVSGICANGKKWNNAELSNWENGLNVNCD